MFGHAINPVVHLDMTWSLRGELADLRLYNISLPLDGLKAYVGCNIWEDEPEPFVNFKKNLLGLEVNGSNRIFNLTLSEICSEPTGYLTLFPDKIDFNKAFSLCNHLLGHLVAPINKEENTKVYDTFSHFGTDCTNTWLTMYWLGVEPDVMSNSWNIIDSGSPITWNNFSFNMTLTNGTKYLCAAMGDFNNPYVWFASPCDLSTCALCNFTRPPTFTLRGMCKDTKFDKSYSLYGYHNGRPVLEGLYISRISWHKENGNWLLEIPLDEDEEEKGAQAIMLTTGPGGYPFGRNLWKVHNDNCGNEEVSLQ